MIFKNVNTLQVVNDFEDTFGTKLVANYPELRDCNINYWCPIKN